MTMTVRGALAEMRDIASETCAAGLRLMDGAKRCTRGGQEFDAGIARSEVGDALDWLDEIRARLTVLGETVAAMEGGSDGD